MINRWGPAQDELLGLVRQAVTEDLIPEIRSQATRVVEQARERFTEITEEMESAVPALVSAVAADVAGQAVPSEEFVSITAGENTSAQTPRLPLTRALLAARKEATRTRQAVRVEAEVRGSAWSFLVRPKNRNTR